MGPRLAVVIPVYREEREIGPCLEHLAGCDGISQCEVVVADGDGGSTHTPLGILPVSVVVSPPGRGVQMNAGAEATSAPAIVFLHVDTTLPRDFVSRVLAALEHAPAGAFDLHIVTRNPVVALISLAGRLRSRITRVPYGDQAHFARRDVFNAVGGYPEEPLMEDVALMDRLKEAGHRIALIRPAARTSDRRWRSDGAIRRTLRNWSLMIRYRRGVSPRVLAAEYPAGQASGQDRAERSAPWQPQRVILFYRALRSGSVKTRLAADIGDEAALAIYRAMVTDLVTALGNLGHAIIPYIDDPAAGVDMLGGGRPQRGEGLDERMDNAFTEVFDSGAEAAVLIGTDIPGIDRESILAAFAALDHSDSVIAPCDNGGYHLVGFRRNRHRPGLLAEVGSPVGEDSPSPDSFGQVTAQLALAGLTVATLPARTDIDTAADLAGYLRANRPAKALRTTVSRYAPHLLQAPPGPETQTTG